MTEALKRWWRGGGQPSELLGMAQSFRRILMCCARRWRLGCEPFEEGYPVRLDADLDLENEARRTGRPTQELLQLYVLEGFLARLAVSEVCGNVVLKGGVLVAALAPGGRPRTSISLV